ncbi:MAG: type II toxin-antitoxin system RelE/ParE family toxin [bacterium]|jgi:hypothetical protein
MTVEFLQTADREFFDAISYYNTQAEGLGFEFAAEISHTLNCIVEFPDAWTLLSARSRRCRTRRFPYGVIYQIRESVILVVAIQNLHRHPDSWKDRLGPEEI